MIVVTGGQPEFSQLRFAGIALHQLNFERRAVGKGLRFFRFKDRRRGIAAFGVCAPAANAIGARTPNEIRPKSRTIARAGHFAKFNGNGNTVGHRFHGETIQNQTAIGPAPQFVCRTGNRKNFEANAGEIGQRRFRGDGVSIDIRRVAFRHDGIVIQLFEGRFTAAGFESNHM